MTPLATSDTVYSQEQLNELLEVGNDPFLFVAKYATTFDETQATEAGAQVVRPFPRLPHIAYYIDEFQHSNILLVPKSRRKLATWTFCALDYWLAGLRKGVKVFIASTKKTKSDKLLARIWHIHTHLPTAFAVPRIERKNGQEGDPTRLDFPTLGSSIQSVSEEPDELRQEGATLVHCEEFQSWKWQEKAWTALRPVVQGGGKIVVIGTPKAGTFWRDLVFDEVGIDPVELR